MRHQKSGRKFSRTSSHRVAMFRNMVTSILEHERIYTTLPRAKDLRRWVDWMITLGKRGDLHARRQALDVVRDKAVVYKLFSELAPRYETRPGGYTRITKMGFRRGDAAAMCLIELIADGARPPVKGRKKKEKAAAEVPQDTAPSAASA